MLYKLYSEDVLIHLIWLTLFMTCSVTYMCHWIPIWKKLDFLIEVRVRLAYVQNYANNQKLKSLIFHEKCFYTFGVFFLFMLTAGTDFLVISGDYLMPRTVFIPFISGIIFEMAAIPFPCNGPLLWCVNLP